MNGYYLDDRCATSVRYYNGQWCSFKRMPDDEVATDPEAINALYEWRSINLEKFLKGQRSKK